MFKPWDDKMKRIFATAPQDLVSWLFPGAIFESIASPELKTSTRTIIADSLSRIRVQSQPAMLHAEFQKQADPEIAERVWEYNMLATRTYHCPVYSSIIYLQPGGTLPEPPLTWGLEGYHKSHIFQYTNIPLWTLTVAELQETQLKGVLPFCVLAQNGARREVVQQVMKQLKDEHELLTLAMGMGSMVLTSEADQQWIQREINMLEDILRDTWFYQHILQQGQQQGLDEGLIQGELQGLQKGELQGLQKGLQKGELQGLQKGLNQGLQKGELQGLQKGLKQGELQGLRQTVIEVVAERFPRLLDLAQSRVDAIHHPVQLRRLIIKMSSVQTVEEAEQYLRDQ